MKAVIHVFIDENAEAKFRNLFENKNIFEYDVKHFVITNCKNINKTIFNGFEQIFYFSEKSEIKCNIKNLIDFLILLNYKELVILHADIGYKENEIFFLELEDLFKHFTVINNIINI
jgi:hypothetical protein